MNDAGGVWRHSQDDVVSVEAQGFQAAADQSVSLAQDFFDSIILLTHHGHLQRAEGCAKLAQRGDARLG
jgi:hypothetical protein